MKKIILMHFGMKNILKNNRKYTSKQTMHHIYILYDYSN
jgi:hypothetical protein